MPKQFSPQKKLKNKKSEKQKNKNKKETTGKGLGIFEMNLKQQSWKKLVQFPSNPLTMKWSLCVCVCETHSVMSDSLTP